MNKSILPFFIFLISYFIFSSNIGGISIYSLDEAKNASCAREMMERGDYIVPTFNYELRTDKPPMHYYFMIIAYKLFGVSEFSARFFSSVFGALTVLITFLFSRRFFGEKVAFYSSLVLISSLHTALQFHMAVPDPYLIFYITLTLFSFYTGFKERNDKFTYLSYLSMGLGVLTKGPVAVVLPAIIVLSFMVYKKSLNLETIKFLKPIRGTILLLAVALPWYIAVTIKTNGQWTYEFIFKHNLSRFSEPMEGHGGLFILTFLFVFFGLLPFSIYVIQTFISGWKNRFKSDFLVFLIFVVVIYVGFFSLSKTKLPNYTTPVYPSFAVLLGYFMWKMKFIDLKKYKVVWSLVFYIFITVLIIVGVYFGLKSEPVLLHLTYLSYFFIVLTIGGIFAVLFYLKKDSSKINFSLSSTSIAMIFLFFYFLFPKIDRQNPVMVMLPLIDKTKPVVAYKAFNPAFAFYLRKPIKKFHNVSNLVKFLKEDKIYILTRKKYLKDIQGIKGLKILKERRDLFEKTTSVLLVYRKG